MQYPDLQRTIGACFLVVWPCCSLRAAKHLVLQHAYISSQAAGSITVHCLWCRMTEAALSYTQLDPSVLSELPQELRDELAAVLPSTSRAGPHSKKHAQLLGAAQDRGNAAAARLNLVNNNWLKGNRAILLEQQQQHEHAQALARQQQGDSAPAEGVVEDAASLWCELQPALESLSAASSNSPAKEQHPDHSSESDPDADDCNVEEERQHAVEEQLEALCNVVLQWSCRQVASSLEDVHYMLRRLAGYSSPCSLVQQSVVRLIQLIQQSVKSAHGAQLVMKQPFA